MNNSPEFNKEQALSSPMQHLREYESQSSRQLMDPEDRAHLERLKNGQRGRIELIMGPMFAGKSTELLRRVQRLEISGRKCLSIKYAADTRYSANSISTHDK